MTATAVVATLLAFVVAAALATALARDVLVAILGFATYGFGLALLWVVFRAPDVGMTEAAVGAGVTSSLLLVAVVRTTRPAVERTFSLDVDPASALVSAGFVGALLLTVPALPAVGSPNAPAFGGSSAFYLSDAETLGFENVVTAVLVVYRGFDTLGEAAVVFAAGIAVLVVFSTEVDR